MKFLAPELILNYVSKSLPTKSFDISQNMYFTLTNYACFRIHGSDTKQFLQSQLTNDISLLEGTSEKNTKAMERTQVSSYCNPKGRVISLMKICRKSKDDYFIMAPSSLAEKIKKRFNLYKLRADVTVSDSSEEYSIFAFIKDDWNEKVHFKKTSFDVETFIYLDSISSNGKECFLVIVKKQNKNQLQTALNQMLDNNESQESLWLASELKNGIPWFTSELTESLLPQQINLDLIKAVSFEKGCYPGQEVVARMHYLGKPKKRSFLLFATSTQSELLNFKKKCPIEIYAKDRPELDEIGTLITYTTSYLNQREASFFGLGEFNLSRVNVRENRNYIIKLPTGNLELELGTLPFQNQILKDVKGQT